MATKKCARGRTSRRDRFGPARERQEFGSCWVVGHWDPNANRDLLGGEAKGEDCPGGPTSANGSLGRAISVDNFPLGVSCWCWWEVGFEQVKCRLNNALGSSLQGWFDISSLLDSVPEGNDMPPARDKLSLSM